MPQMKQISLWPCAAILLAAAITGLAEDRKLPEGRGLSAKHKGDHGIGDDPAVVIERATGESFGTDFDAWVKWYESRYVADEARK